MQQRVLALLQQRQAQQVALAAAGVRKLIWLQRAAHCHLVIGHTVGSRAQSQLGLGYLRS